MNMLTSLKALLFSSAAVPGTAVAAAPGQDTADFAAMLSGSMEEALPADPAAAPVVPQVDAEAPVATLDVLPNLDQPAQPAAHGHVPHGLAVAVGAGQGTPAALPPGLALGLVKRQPDMQPAPQVEGEAEAVAVEAEPASGALQPQPQEAGETAEIKPAAKPHQVRHEKELAPEEVPIAADAEPKLKAKPKVDKTVDEAKSDKPVMSEPAVAPVIPPAIPIAVAPTPASAAVETGQDEGDTPSAPQIAPSASLALAALPVTPPVAEDGRPEVQPKPAPMEQVAVPPLNSAVRQGGPLTEEKPLLATETQEPSAPILNGKPVKAEALALLQLVRDQVAARQSGGSVRVGEQVSAAASGKAKPAGLEADAGAGASASVGAGPSISMQPLDAAPPSPGVASHPLTAQAAAPSAPAVDLSASLGARMVDMGVSGQWIDGLARDIAGLTANGAQGRFQIDTHHLGAVQVDIRQGGDGAAVSLTVASEAAEAALRQDSDRLKLDAGLAAVRISDVRVERAAPVAEAHRADMGNPSSSQQQQPQQQGSQTASAWQQNNQNMGQPQGQQGRWQGRENNAFGPKGNADPAVLNHADAQPRAQDAVRARYA